MCGYSSELTVHKICFFPDKINITKYLLEHGAEIDARNNQGKTPLLTAIKDGYYVAQPMDKYDVVKLLLEKGATINIQDNNGDTALHSVVQNIIQKHHIGEYWAYYVNQELCLNGIGFR